MDQWRAVYPPEIFTQQLEKVAGGFEQSLAELKSLTHPATATTEQRRVLERECAVAAAAGIHFRSAANQARFVLARDRLAKSSNAGADAPHRAEMEHALRSEIVLARRLYELQRSDSRLGFEASNQYCYVPVDLMEKVLNCHQLLARLLPG